MISLIEMYIEKLTIEDLYRYALNQNINLSQNELNFSFSFLKNNYKEILKNPASFNFKDYTGYYSNENFVKIEYLINKYKHYL